MTNFAGSQISIDIHFHFSGPVQNCTYLSPAGHADVALLTVHIYSSFQRVPELHGEVPSEHRFGKIAHLSLKQANLPYQPHRFVALGGKQRQHKWSAGGRRAGAFPGSVNWTGMLHLYSIFSHPFHTKMCRSRMR